MFQFNQDSIQKSTEARCVYCTLNSTFLQVLKYGVFEIMKLQLSFMRLDFTQNKFGRNSEVNFSGWGFW